MLPYRASSGSKVRMTYFQIEALNTQNSLIHSCTVRVGTPHRQSLDCAGNLCCTDSQQDLLWQLARTSLLDKNHTLLIPGMSCICLVHTPRTLDRHRTHRQNIREDICNRPWTAPQAELRNLTSNVSTRRFR